MLSCHGQLLDVSLGDMMIELGRMVVRGSGDGSNISRGNFGIMHMISIRWMLAHWYVEHVIMDS